MKKGDFPGFKKCMEMMRSSDPQIQEDGFSLLLPHVSNHLETLIQAFRSEEDQGLKCWLLELIGETKLPESFDILNEQLENEHESLRYWAIIGLKKLDSKAARTALFRKSIKK